MKRWLIVAKGSIFILADSTKVANVHQFIVSDINSFNYLITDKRATDDQMVEFEDYGIKTVRLDPVYNYNDKTGIGGPTNKS